MIMAWIQGPSLSKQHNKRYPQGSVWRRWDIMSTPQTHLKTLLADGTSILRPYVLCETFRPRYNRLLFHRRLSQNTRPTCRRDLQLLQHTDHPRRILGRVKRTKAANFRPTRSPRTPGKVIPAFASARTNCAEVRAGSRLPFSPCGCLRPWRGPQLEPLEDLRPFDGRTNSSPLRAARGPGARTRNSKFAPAFATGSNTRAAPPGWSSIVADHMSARLT